MSQHSSAVAVAVGQPFPDASLTASRGCGWHSNNGLILVCDDDLTKDDNDAFADMRVHIVADGPVIALILDAARFGWVELPTVRLSDLPAWADPGEDLSADARATFHLVLVDYQTQLVVGQRLFTVSPHFTQVLRREALDRWAEPLDRSVFQVAMQRWYSKYGERKDALKATLASCRSGA